MKYLLFPKWQVQEPVNRRSRKPNIPSKRARPPVRDIHGQRDHVTVSFYLIGLQTNDVLDGMLGLPWEFSVLNIFEIHKYVAQTGKHR